MAESLVSWKDLTSIQEGLSERALAQAFAVARALKEEMMEGVRELVTQAGSRAVLRNYSADCTPLRVSVRFSEKASCGLAGHVVREGKQQEDILFQIAFYVTLNADLQPSMCYYSEEPVAMSAGHKAWNMYSAEEAFTASLKSMHEGISISCYTFDRGAMAGLRQHIYEKHCTQLTYSARDPVQQELGPLLDWVMVVPCSQHDMHNALKWGLGSLSYSTQILEDLHITMASCRNAFADLHAHVYPFVQTCVDFVECWSQSEQTGWQRFWICMDVDAEYVDLLMRYQLRWHAQTSRLRMLRDSLADEEDMSTVTGIIYKLLRIQVFTESRWLSIGDSCRAFTGAMAIGLEKIVQLTRANPEVSDYYIAGFQRAGPDAKYYAACAAVASHVADAAHMSLLEDDRLVRTWQSVMREMQEEVNQMATQPLDFWRCIARVMGNSNPEEIRTSCMHVGLVTLVTLAYAEQKTFRRFKTLPFSLYSGDINANLEVLAARGEEPIDPLAAKIWKLVRIGHLFTT
eukprot:6492284-Amphidinium_carterae.1